MSHYMIDLETLGTRPTSMIVSFGAVEFDNDGIKDEIYTPINLKSYDNLTGFTFDVDTLKWWMDQEDAARALFNDERALHLSVPLVAFRDLLQEDDKVWGNGASFDNVILAHAYRALGMEVPWKFWNERCYRTLKNFHREIPMSRVGTFHNALDDAKSQALHAIDICNKKGIEL